MEVLFENTYLRDKALVRELYRYYYFKRPFVLVVYGLLAAAMGVNLWLVLVRDWYFNIFSAGLVGFVLIMQFATYRVQVAGLLEGDRDMTGGTEAQITMQALPTGIRVLYPWGSTQDVPYEDIRRVSQTRRLILLWASQGRVHAFRKDAFTCGTEDAFLAFLHEKI